MPGSKPNAVSTVTGLHTEFLTVLDRLLHHVHVVQISGRSYRLKELDALLRPSATEAHGPVNET